jgi:hypothetical protein
MGAVKAKIQTVEDIYRLVWTAVASKQPMRAIYKEHPRLFCPHRLPQPLNVRSNSPMLNAAACTSTRLNVLAAYIHSPQGAGLVAVHEAAFAQLAAQFP